jgi:hypothetical protein
MLANAGCSADCVLRPRDRFDCVTEVGRRDPLPGAAVSAILEILGCNAPSVLELDA